MRIRWKAVLAAILTAAVALPASAATAAGPAPRDAVRGGVGGEERAVRAFWTPERIGQARPPAAPEEPVTGRSGDGRPPAETSPETSAGPVLVPGRAPASSVAAASLAQFATPTVGAMYTNGDDGYQYWCSASTVPSGNRNLILTAAHCVYDRDRGTWRTKGIYMPFYRYGPDPAYGSWVLDQAFVSQDWLSGGGRANDVAFVTVRPRSDGVRIEDVTGSNGMGFFPPPWYQGTVFGYPGEPPYDGNLQMNCTVYISLSIAKCPFTGGSSGGPWLRDYQNERRWGYVTGLTSTGVAGTDVRSPDFGFSAYSLWQGAQAG